MSLHSDLPSTPGKFKPDKSPFHRNSLRLYSSKLPFYSLLFLSLLLLFLYFISPRHVSLSQQPNSSSTSSSSLKHVSFSPSWGGPAWEKKARHSAHPKPGPNKKVILVTGAAGFVGSHVAMALRRRGDGVIGLDNFNDYYEVNLKRSRQKLLERSGVFVVEGDINDFALVSKLFDVVVFTHVVHLAAQAGVRYAMKNPNSYINSNIAGLVNILEVSKNANPQPAVVWASSSSVYGLNSKVPFSESDRTDKPASLYAATKKAGEEITHSYNHIYGLSITGLRFFTVYGPWGRPDMAYFFFTKDMLRGKMINVYEGASRDFTYIDDIVKGCLGAVDTAKKSTGSGGKKRGEAEFRLFNLGNTKPVSVGELVGILERLLGVKAKKRVMALPRNGDVQFTHANISLAMKEIGYKPSVDLETGLKKFVRWYLNYYSGNKKLRNAVSW